MTFLLRKCKASALHIVSDGNVIFGVYSIVKSVHIFPPGTK